MPAQNLPGLMLNYAHPLSRGLVGWWPMNEGAGTRVADISGNGNHANTANVLQGSTSGWSGGFAGRSIMFDAVDDTLTAPHSTSISNALLSTVGFSITGWMYFRTLANYAFLGFKGTGGGVPGPVQVYWEPSPGYWVFLIGGGGSHGGPGSAIGPHVVDRWYHIAAVRNGATGYIYINGKVSGTPAGGFGTPTDDGNAYCMFARTPSFYSPVGSMCHARLYNRALSAVEVAQLYADPLAGALTLVRASRYYVAVSGVPKQMMHYARMRKAR